MILLFQQGLAWQLFLLHVIWLERLSWAGRSLAALAGREGPRGLGGPPSLTSSRASPFSQVMDFLHGGLGFKRVLVEAARLLRLELSLLSLFYHSDKSHCPLRFRKSGISVGKE